MLLQHYMNPFTGRTKGAPSPFIYWQLRLKKSFRSTSIGTQETTFQNIKFCNFEGENPFRLHSHRSLIVPSVIAIPFSSMSSFLLDLPCILFINHYLLNNASHFDSEIIPIFAVAAEMKRCTFSELLEFRLAFDNTTCLFPDLTSHYQMASM